MYRYLYRILVCVWFWMLICVLLYTHTYALSDPTKYKYIKIYKSRNVDTQFPERAKPHQEKNINYWISVLPEKKDRFMDAYIVVPGKGIVAPVVMIPKESQKYKDTLNGKQPDFTKDLNKGIFHYPGTPWPQSFWNGVYFAHTSQFLSDKSKYGTIGQAFAWLDPARPKTSWDIIYYYKKIWLKIRALYQYEVTSERRTDDTDMTIFHQNLQQREISIVGCVDRGTARQRWITRWSLKTISLLSYTHTWMQESLVYPYKNF